MNTPDTSKPVPSAPKQRKFSRKSTATEAQYERLLEMLRVGPKNTMELRRGGVMMPAARIKELNDKYGYYIPTINLVTITDEWGYPHLRVAVYELIDSPRQPGPRYEW